MHIRGAALEVPVGPSSATLNVARPKIHFIFVKKNKTRPPPRVSHLPPHYDRCTGRGGKDHAAQGYRTQIREDPGGHLDLAKARTGGRVEREVGREGGRGVQQGEWTWEVAQRRSRPAGAGSGHGLYLLA